MKMRVQEIAELVGGTVVGDAKRQIQSVASLDNANQHDLSFIASATHAASAESYQAGCLLVPRDWSLTEESRSYVLVENPKYAFLQILRRAFPGPAPEPGIHPTAIIAESAIVADNVSIGPFVVIEAGAQIGAGCVIRERVSIGRDCIVGENCRLFPNVILYAQVTLGNRVIIHSGSVIGSDGFGYVPNDGVFHKFPQVGSVTIEDDVELGANSCVDRGTLDQTRIQQGTKIDNLVQIAHNVNIGRHCAVAAQTGIAGSATIHDSVICGGQVGVADHAVIEQHVVIAAQSGISTGKRVYSKQTVGGTPARGVDSWIRNCAMVARLPRMFDRINKLEAQVQKHSTGNKD